MPRSGWRGACVLAVLAAVSAGALAAPPGEVRPALAAQTSREGGVTVTVAPKRLAPGAPSWDFEVTLETHTQALNQDLARAALLVDAQGKSHEPLAWDGDAPGGHHRRGLLRFRPLVDGAATVELRILGVGGVAVRTFRWQRE